MSSERSGVEPGVQAAAEQVVAEANHIAHEAASEQPVAANENIAHEPDPAHVAEMRARVAAAVRPDAPMGPPPTQPDSAWKQAGPTTSAPPEQWVARWNEPGGPAISVPGRPRVPEANPVHQDPLLRLVARVRGFFRPKGRHAAGAKKNGDEGE